MARMVLILLLSALGGTFFLHYLKNFVLKEKTASFWDWDGLIERALITGIIVFAGNLIYLVPLIILLKAVFRLGLIGFFGNLTKTTEAGAVPQKVRLKAELAFDLILSPAFAILVGIIF